MTCLHIPLKKPHKSEEEIQMQKYVQSSEALVHLISHKQMISFPYMHLFQKIKLQHQLIPNQVDVIVLHFDEKFNTICPLNLEVQPGADELSLA